MKEGWHIETISSLCEQMNGIWKGEKEPLTTAKILRTTNFSKDCQMKLDDLAIIEVEQKKMEKRRLKRGDIIVEKSGGGPKQPVGRVILFNIDDDDFSFCNFTSALRIKDQTKILPEFLHKYLTYLYFSGETEKYQSNLVGFRNLDFKGYVSICVKYPSLSEQQRIVSLLDAEFAKIDALKANAEKNLRNAKDLFQAALKKELEPKDGWNNYRLGDICTITSSKRIYKNEYVKEGVPFYRTKEIKEIANDQPISLELYISTERYMEIKKKYGVPQINDILVSAVGTIGEMMIVKDDNPFYFKDGNLVWLRNITKTSAEYLRYYLLSAINRIKEITIGAAYNALTIEKFQEMQIGLASESNVQQTIVARLDALSEKCKTLQANYEKTLSLCDGLKQALLRKAFNGEI